LLRERIGFVLLASERHHRERPPEESALYRKYVATLSKQEDELQELREERTKTNEKLQKQRADFETFLLEQHVP
jgi:DNA-binding PadR family transcriptional regulator